MIAVVLTPVTAVCSCQQVDWVVSDELLADGRPVRKLARNGFRDLNYRFSRHTEPAAQEAASMARRQKKMKRHKPKTILRFPDLEQSKCAVVNSAPSSELAGVLPSRH